MVTVKVKQIYIIINIYYLFIIIYKSILFIYIYYYRMGVSDYLPGLSPIAGYALSKIYTNKWELTNGADNHLMDRAITLNQ